MLAGPEDQEEILDSVSSKMSAQDDRCKQLDEQSERLVVDVQKVWARLEEQEGKLAAMSSKMSAQEERVRQMASASDARQDERVKQLSSAQDERVRQLEDRSKQARDILQESVMEDLDAMRQEIKLISAGGPVQRPGMPGMPGAKGTDQSRLAATERELKTLAAEVRALRFGYEATSEVRVDTQMAFSGEVRKLESETCTETVKAIEQAIVELRAAHATAQEEAQATTATASPRLAGLAAEVKNLKTSVEEARAEVKASQDEGKLAGLEKEMKQLRAGAEASMEMRNELQEALQTEIRTVMEKDNKRNDVIIEQLMEVTNKVVEEEHSIRIELTGRIDVLEDAVAELNNSQKASGKGDRRSRSRGGGTRLVA